MLPRSSRSVRVVLLVALATLLSGCGSVDKSYLPPVTVLGFEHVVLPLPGTWTESDFECGVPQSDTVQYALAGIGPGCDPPIPVAGIETVTIGQFLGRGSELQEDPNRYRLTIDGLDARRDRVRCVPAKEFYLSQGGGADVCSASLWFPSLDSFITVTSTTSGETVNDLLDRAEVDPDRFVVPHPSFYFNMFQEKSGEEYARVLREAGIATTVLERRSSSDQGYAEEVSPKPGTVLRPGGTATVTVSGPVLPRAEQFGFGVFTRPESTYGEQSAGGEQGDPSRALKVGPGDRLNGEFTGGDQQADLRVELVGSSLAVQKPNEPGIRYSWRAVGRGVTTLNFTAVANGTRRTVGSVVVTVG